MAERVMEVLVMMITTMCLMLVIVLIKPKCNVLSTLRFHTRMTD